MKALRESDLAEVVLGMAFEVSRELGCGLLEKPYQNGLKIALEQAGLVVELEREFPVYFRKSRVGVYFADLVVEGRLVVECKSVDCFTRDHFAQLYNYLRLSKIDVGLLINFRHQLVSWKRIEVDLG